MTKAFLGIDYGRARIGLAVSEAGLIARPVEPVANKGERKNLVAIGEVVRRYNVGCIVVGLPVHKNTAMADEVRVFAKSLETLGTEIVFQNEMLTSVTAEEEIRTKMGINNAKKITKLIDSVAASMILNDYLKGE